MSSSGQTVNNIWLALSTERQEERNREIDTGAGMSYWTAVLFAAQRAFCMIVAARKQRSAKITALVFRSLLRNGFQFSGRPMQPAFQLKSPAGLEDILRTDDIVLVISAGDIKCDGANNAAMVLITLSEDYLIRLALWCYLVSHATWGYWNKIYRPIS